MHRIVARFLAAMSGASQSSLTTDSATDRARVEQRYILQWRVGRWWRYARTTLVILTPREFDFVGQTGKVPRLRHRNSSECGWQFTCFIIETAAPFPDTFILGRKLCIAVIRWRRIGVSTTKITMLHAAAKNKRLRKRQRVNTFSSENSAWLIYSACIIDHISWSWNIIAYFLTKIKRISH